MEMTMKSSDDEELEDWKKRQPFLKQKYDDLKSFHMDVNNKLPGNSGSKMKSK